MGRKEGELPCSFRRGSWVPVKHSVAWAEVHFRTKWRLHPSIRLATIDMGQKLGGAVPFFLAGGAGSPIEHKVAWAEAYLHIPSGILVHPGSVWPQRTLAENWGIQPFGHNRYGPKIGGSAPLGEGELGLHLTQCGQDRGLPACQVSSRSIQPFGHSTPTSQTGQTTV